jgi:hypothetical protein
VKKKKYEKLYLDERVLLKKTSVELVATKQNV